MTRYLEHCIGRPLASRPILACHHCHLVLDPFAQDDYRDTGGRPYCSACLEDAYTDGVCSDCGLPVRTPCASTPHVTDMAVAR